MALLPGSANLVEHLPELGTARGLLRAFGTVLITGLIAIGLLWLLEPRSAFLALVIQLAVYGVAYWLMGDFLAPGHLHYAEAFFNRALPAMGLHLATVLFVLTSSSRAEEVPRLIPPAIGVILGAYLVLTGIGIAARALREAGVDTLAGLPMYFPEAGRLVTGSVYSVIRHPNYAGLARIALGFAMLAGTPFALMLALLFVAVYQPRWIDREEQELRKRLGDDYSSFASSRPALFPTSADEELALVRGIFRGSEAPANAEDTSA